jgi:hypothetical protein
MGGECANNHVGNDSVVLPLKSRLRAARGRMARGADGADVESPPAAPRPGVPGRRGK